MADTNSISCAICSAPFKPTKGKSNKFCSLDCYRVSQRRGDYNRGHKPETYRSPCGYCGKLVIGQRSRKRNGEKSDHLFCDRDCYDKHRDDAIKARAKPCRHCGGMFSPDMPYRVYCSSTCMYAARKAKPTNCVNCGCLFTPMKFMAETGKLISVNKAKTCSAKCNIEWISNNQERKEKISLAFTGSKHPNWQGGSHYMASRGAGWQKTRRDAKKKAGYKCEHCGITEQECLVKYKCGLHINHIKPFHQFGGKTQLANRQSNLEALCRSCHTKADHKWRKENPVQYSLAGMFK